MPSYLEQEVLNVLSEIYPYHKIYTEYNVKLINPVYHHNHRFDIAIPSLNLVFECHGIQHYKPIEFFSKDVADSIFKFREIQWSDNLKKDAALESGWWYILIPYTMQGKVDRMYLQKLILEAYNAQVLGNSDDKQFSQNKHDVYKEELRQKAKVYRKKKYQQAKEWRKKHGWS